MPLIAEDVLLLLLDDDSGTVKITSYPRAVVGGAVLAELVLAGQVIVGQRPSLWHRPRLATTSAAPPADPILRQAYDHIARYPQAASDAVAELGRRAIPKLSQRLADQGVLAETRGKTLGVFPRTRWPEADASRERRLRDDLAAVLVGGATPDPRLGPVIALINAAGITAKVVDRGGLTRSELQRRAREVADGDWAAKAVKDAIAAASAAIITASTATGAALVVSMES